MRIEWTPPLRPAATRREGKTDAARESFAAALDGDTAALPAAPSPGIGAVAGLLTVQEVSDELGRRRRRAVQRADALLDRLEELRLGLLAARLPRDRLEELARLARTAGEKIDDPRLALLLDEIDLRVAVELAKLDAGL